MKKIWDQLRPKERNLVIAIGVIAFIVWNYFFIWPRFGDWGRNKKRLEDARNRISDYNKEVGRMAEYNRQINEFGSEAMESDDQAFQFQTACNDCAVQAGLSAQSWSPPRQSTSAFVMEQQVTARFTGSEPQIVNFLYRLSSGNSLMRVRAMNLHPLDANRYQLSADMTIVASYQRKPPPAAPRKGATASAAPPAPRAVAATPAPAPAVTPAPAAKTNSPAVPSVRTFSATNKTGPQTKIRP